jgi:hypothetical protein
VRRERKQVCVETLKPLTTKVFQRFKECKLVREQQLVDGGVHLLVGFRILAKNGFLLIKVMGGCFLLLLP